MLTPHMTELAHELVLLGVDIHFVVEADLSDERRAMGWVTGNLAEITVHFVDTPKAACALVDRFPVDAVHITQGVRANGLVADAQKRIDALWRRHFPIIEKVDLRGPAGWIKPLIYAVRFRKVLRRANGMLCIGDGTDAWVAKHAPREIKVFPFAYFLRGRIPDRGARVAGSFRFIFVGSLIKRKRVDLLVEALAALADRPFELEIVGDGPMKGKIKDATDSQLPRRVAFCGTLPMRETIERIKAADCLVLPSDHDGFGAVLSEALINGTHAICSSKCGAAEAVHASGKGAVFTAGDADDLRRILGTMLDRGPFSAACREDLASWARCLTAEAGAHYLLRILNHNSSSPVMPPWERGR